MSQYDHERHGNIFTKIATLTSELKEVEKKAEETIKEIRECSNMPSTIDLDFLIRTVEEHVKFRKEELKWLEEQVYVGCTEQ